MYTNAATTNTTQPAVTVLRSRTSCVCVCALCIYGEYSNVTFVFLSLSLYLILIFISFLLPLFRLQCFSFILMHATKPSSFICVYK